MTETEKRVPELRFEGFIDDWEQRELKEILKVNSGRDYKHLGSGSIPVYGTGGYMLSVNDKLSDKDAIGIGRKGTIDKPQYLKAPFWTVDTLFFMIPLNNFDLQFLYTMTQKINWKKMDESTGVPSLSKAIIEKVNQNIPSYQEQIKIGDFFKQLDNTIALHQRKLNLLKLLKQTYLNTLFAQNGENSPALRFAGFSEPWEQRKLGELAEVKTGKAFGSADFNDDGEYLVVTNKNIQDDINGITSVGDRIDIFEETILNNYLLSGNNILVTMDGVNIGKTGKYSNEKAVLAQRVGRLNSEQFEFIYQVTNNNKFLSEMNKLSVGNAIKHISLKQISDYSFEAPINKVEQKKIGTCFKHLDDTIALHKQKVAHLQSMKSIFLNKMFV